MRPNAHCLLKTLLFSCFILLLRSPAFAQYADQGTGALKNQIWWIDWNGFSIANGASKTFTTSNGLTVTASFSNVTGPVLTPTVMNTWSGAVLHLLYNFSSPGILPALYHSSYQSTITSFKLTILATRNGSPVPIQFIAADAEASAVTEITTLTTNGSSWNTIDFFRNSSQTSNPLTGCNTNTVKITDTYGNASQVGQNPVVSTKSPLAGSLAVDVSMDHSGISGQMGLAFGILEAVDRGDLPASYGFAQHQITYTYNNSCNYMPPFPSALQSNNLKIGSTAGDADGLQSTDDNLQGGDEDGVSSFPIYTGNGSYSLTLPVTNTTGNTAYLTGWFDMNGNSSFDVGESQTVTVPNNVGSATLSWLGLPSTFSRGVNYGFRFRLSSDLSAVQNASGFAKDGEVEDFLVPIPQNVSVGFVTPDTVCINTPVTINNTTVGASTYYWNFCVANSATAPTGVNLSGIGFNQPAFMDYAKDGNNYYGFVINHLVGRLIRLDFGTSLLNNPTYVDLGNFGGAIPVQCEGIQIVKNEGKWYAIMVGGQPVGRIVKIDFGASLSNSSPTGTNWGNIGTLAFPTDLHIFQDGNNWYGLTINAQTNTITRFNFSNSFDNLPTGINIGNFGGMNYPTGIYAIFQNGNWYAFVSNNGNGLSNSGDASITRLNFGSSLSNTPTGINLGNPGNLLSSSRDLTIYQSCNEIFGFVVNNTPAREIIRLNFNNSLTSVPTAVNLGNIGNLSFPHSISKLFREGSDLYSFITNVDNHTLTRLKFSGCNTSSIVSSTVQNPSPVIYNAIGNYTINLTVDDGLPTQSAYCKTITVVENLHTPIQSKSFCAGDSILLTSARSYGNSWNTGSASTSIWVKTPGIYWVQSSIGGCTNIDSFLVSAKPLPVVNLGVDTSFCLLDSLVLNAGNIGATYSWQNAQTTQLFVVKQAGLYHVAVNLNGCVRKDSILIGTLSLPLVSLSNDTSICINGVATLQASGGITYNWSPSSSLSSSNGAVVTAHPNSTTQYYVTVTGSNGCKAKDSVQVSVTTTTPCSLNVVNIGFITPDTVCVNTPVNITNTTTGASSYYWNFCVADLNVAPTGQNLGNIQNRFSQPVFMDYAFYNNNYYGFVVNHSPGALIRLEYGNSLLNTPTSTNLGNFGGIIPSGPGAEGIQVVFNEGKWYAVIVGGYQPSGSTPRILKIDFGSNLTNLTPVATNWGNLGNMSQPIDLHVFKEGSNWYGFTVSAENNTITRFNFTSSFNNTPSGVNLGNIGNLSYPTGIYAINDNGFWRVFITNGGTVSRTSTNASLTRLDFGSSLLNAPVGINLGNPGNALQHPRDLTILKQCGQIVGFVANGHLTNNGVAKLDFQNNLSAVPVSTSLGSIGGTTFPHSISKLFRVNEDVYGFITNADNNTLTRLKFTGCTNANIPNSTQQNPPAIIYNSTGTYNINLTIDDGLATQTALCKQVVVVEITHTPTQNKTICAGDSILLTSAYSSGNVWNTGSTGSAIYVKTPGIYSVQSTKWGCVNIDSFVVAMKPSPIVNLGADTAFCKFDSLVLHAGNAGASYLWQGGQTTQNFVAKQNGLYYVTVTANGCSSRDSILISSLPLPVVFLSKDTSVCKSGTVLLTAGGGTAYTWSPAPGFAGSTNAGISVKPDTTTKYYVTVSNQYNCQAKDSVTVTVLPNPIVNIGADTSLCTLDSLVLSAGNNGASYLWQNNQTTQTIVVNSGGTYYVTVKLNGCKATDSLVVADLPSPNLILSADTSICKPGLATLLASGGDSYNWLPANGLPGTVNPVVTVNPDTTTTYHVTATNVNGCIAKDSVTVSVFARPVVNLGIDTSLCSADSLVLNAGNAGASFSWQNGQTTQTFVVKNAALYFVTVTKNGCSTKDSIVVSPLSSPIVTLSPDSTICKTGMANLIASGGVQYSWYPSTGLSNNVGAIVTASPDTTTTYYLTVKSANNCTAKDSVMVSVIPKPAFAVHASKPILCLGDTAILTATGGNSYSWQPTLSVSSPLNSMTEAFPINSTLFSVAIQNNSCNLIDTLFINLPVADKPLAKLTKSNDINCFQGQAMLTASGGSSFIWRPSVGLSDSTKKSAVASINQTSTYHVFITTVDGCQVEDSITVYVEKGDDGSGFPVPGAFTPNGDGKNDCYGVPYWGAVTEFSLNLYNRWGERIFYTNSPSQCWDGIYKGVLQPTDVYVYWIKAKTRCGDVFRKGTFALIR